MSSPTIRLATLGPPLALEKGLSPTVRLAIGMGPACRNGTLDAPTVRIGIGGKTGPDGEERRYQSLAPAEVRPGLLTSFVFLENFLRYRHRYHYRDWVLDSGAYSAFASGVPIDLGAYIRKCRELLGNASPPVEIYSLDVIGDWKASLRNTEFMWKAGIQAIPAYHIGEPWDVLKAMARDYPKIALGGVARKRGEEKRSWALKCVSMVWPKKVHGFGFGEREHIMTVPFHSVDATNWEIGPCRFGNWRQFGKMSIRGSSQNLRGEVQHFLKIEAEAQARWSREMAELEAA
jgi:hypothetical protein